MIIFLAYIIDFSSASAKIVFLREDRKEFYLTQEYGSIRAWRGVSSLTISDLNKVLVCLLQTKRIVMLSMNTKLVNKSFFVKFLSFHAHMCNREYEII